jgi:hypothetical protein
VKRRREKPGASHPGLMMGIEGQLRKIRGLSMEWKEHSGNRGEISTNRGKGGQEVD